MESKILSTLRSRHPYYVLLGIYVVATWFTDAFFMGDTWIYARDIVKADSLRANYWDFGHPLWRPFGWLIAGPLAPVLALGGSEEPRTDVTSALLAINWAFGPLGVMAAYALAERFSTRRWIAYLVAVTFLFSNAILNYTQTGQPYVPGVSLLLLGLYLLVRSASGKRSVHTSVIAGVVLAVGVCCWLPLFCALPAILLSPVVLFGRDRARVRLVIVSLLVCGFMLTLAYGLMAVNLGIHDMQGLKAWIGSSSHGVEPDPLVKSIERMIFSLGRNFINMGDDGRLFKRYLVHDPFSPVSVYDLVRFSIVKLAIFYAFLAAMVINLQATMLGRKTLGLLVVNALPVLAFALFLFESGSIDRYLPLFPTLFLALAVAFGSAAAKPWTRYVALLFAMTVVFASVSAMSVRALDGAQEKAALRIRDLVPLLTSRSRVVTLNQQDEIYAFNQNFPFDPINRSGHFDADILVDSGTTQVATWRQIFAAKTLEMWDKGGDVWVTKRVLAERPQLEWNWVEGDDPDVSWADVRVFCAPFEMGQSVGGHDGFVLVLPSPRNKKLLGGV
jgi:hypothetical protein